MCNYPEIIYTYFVKSTPQMSANKTKYITTQFEFAIKTISKVRNIDPKSKDY